MSQPGLVFVGAPGRYDGLFVEIVDRLRSRSRHAGRQLQSVRIYLNSVRMKTSGRWKERMNVLRNEDMNAAVRIDGSQRLAAAAVVERDAQARDRITEK